MCFPYLSPANLQGKGQYMPYLPLDLRYKNQTLNAHGLLDTGSAVNLLPYEMGLSLGAVWEKQTIPLTLTGNLARFEARAVFVEMYIEGHSWIELAFAWTRSENAPLLLGQTNFFMEFDVLFSRSALFFEVTPKGKFK